MLLLFNRIVSRGCKWSKFKMAADELEFCFEGINKESRLILMTPTPSKSTPRNTMEQLDLS